MWCWVISPFYNICSFWNIDVNITDKQLFLYLYLLFYWQFQYIFSTRCNIYISCLCYDVSVRLSFRFQFTAHCGHGACGRKRWTIYSGKGSSPGRVEGSSRAVLATAKPSCIVLRLGRAIMHQHTKILRKSVHMWDIIIFSIIQMVTGHHLEFLKLKNLFTEGVWRAETCHPAKCHQNWSVCGTDIAIYVIFQNSHCCHFGSLK